MKSTTSLLVACAWLAACTESQRVVPIRMTDSGTLQAMYQEIYDLAEDRSCGNLSDCASLPLGSKPCGGPWLYLVYSKPRVHEIELQAKAIQLALYEEEYNREYHRSSMCDYAIAPNLGCVNGECVDLDQSP